jgi:hypothetical protein
VSANPAPNPPVQAPSTAWYARFQRWWVAHVNRRLPGTKRQRIVRLARASLAYHGRMVYTEGPQRSELFHRARGAFRGAHADCSQYSATLCHWVGVGYVTDTDWTGTLAKKGRQIERPVRGAFVFFGAPPYVHMGVLVKPMLSRSWHVIGFGNQAAPDENTLPALLGYFAARGHAGHQFRDLTR